MNHERKKQFSQLRKEIAALTEDRKINLVGESWRYHQVDGRTLSRPNTLLLMMQAGATFPTVVGGYRQWQKAGRQVQKGQHGLMIWYPSRKKKQDEDENEGQNEKPNFFVGTVFDISQTEEKPAY